MIESFATVVAVNAHRVTVHYERREACGHCDQASSCSLSAGGNSADAKSQLIEIDTDVPVCVGQQVRIGIPEKKLLNTVFLVYGLPLLLVLIGACSGQFLAPDSHFADLYAVCGAVLGGCFGFLGVRWAAKRMKSAVYQPVILGVTIPLLSEN